MGIDQGVDLARDQLEQRGPDVSTGAVNANSSRRSDTIPLFGIRSAPPPRRISTAAEKLSAIRYLTVKFARAAISFMTSIANPNGLPSSST